MVLSTPWFHTAGLQNCERMHFCCFSHSVCSLFWQPYKTDIRSNNRTHLPPSGAISGLVWTCPGRVRGNRGSASNIQEIHFGAAIPHYDNLVCFVHHMSSFSLPFFLYQLSITILFTDLWCIAFFSSLIFHSLRISDLVFLYWPSEFLPLSFSLSQGAMIDILDEIIKMKAQMFL